MEEVTALSWPAAIAIIGSVATIIISIFGYLLKVRNGTTSNQVGDTSSTREYQVRKEDTARAEALSTLLEQVSEVKLLVMTDNKEIGILKTEVNSIRKTLSDQETRSQRDFESAFGKIDKLYDIVMKILQDEKL